MASPPQRGITVKYWKSHAPIAFGEHTSLNLIDLSWSPDGGWLASLGDDGTLLVWPMLMP
jgi:WD40 repeat protein